MPYKDKEKKKEVDKKYYEEHKQEIQEKANLYQEQNREKILKQRKEFRDANKEQLKKQREEFYKNNKDKVLEKCKEYYEKNKDGKIKEYNENRKDIKDEYNKKYFQENKEKRMQYQKEYTKCRSCKLFQTGKKTNWLCSYCNPEKTKRQKTKKIKLKTFLENNNYKFIYNKKCNINNSCQTYYPDFLIDNGTFFLIIECDEDAHKSYDYNCERIRENNICFALGLPCVFIRFNPDAGVKKRIKIKEKILKSYIDYYLSKEICNNEINYLFY